MKKYILTEDQKEEILYYLKTHSTLSIKNILNQLEEEKENFKDFFEEVKKLVREKGKSNMISKSEIESLLVKYGKVLQE